MNPETANVIANFIEKVVKFSKLVEPVRLVSTLQTNGYVGSVFEKRNFQYKYVEGFDLSPDQLNPMSDILYVEIPEDYTFDQHQELAKTMSKSIFTWVIYTRFSDLVKSYYTNFTQEGNCFTNGI